jgi:hypothetical protein
MSDTAAAAATTDGVSPKAHAATIAPLAGGLAVALVNWAITGHFDTTSIAAVIGGSGGGLVAGAAAYIAKPGPGLHIAGDLVGDVERDAPGAAAKVETFIHRELERIPAPFRPLEIPLEADVIDPLAALIPVTKDPPPDEDSLAKDPANATLAAQAEELAELRAQLAELRAQLAELRAQLAAYQTPPDPVAAPAAGVTV